MKKQSDQYFQVISSEQADSADILLYGYIGQDDWWDEDRKEERITDIAFIQKLSELASRYQRINIRINSPGGSVYHGDAIIAAIRNCEAEIHTYNDGMAASIAAVIWLAGHQRHMSVNAKLMLHSTSTIIYGTAKDLRQAADQLDTFDAASVAVIAAATGMNEDQVKEMFFDYEDHWYAAKQCVEMGLIGEVEQYESQNTPDNVEQMTYSQLLSHFSTKGDQVAQNWLGRLRDRIGQVFHPAPVALQTINSSKNQNSMDIKEFQNSLEQGDIKLEEVIQHLSDQGYKVEAPKTPEQQATESMTSTVTAAVQAAINPLNEKITQLEGKLAEIGAQPGANATQTATPAPPDAKQAWLQQNAKEANDSFTKATETGERVKFS
ncbi:head maturation protease, ClpP-related [Flavilitoribacter nigricans]|uniref:ATP-dependent Clp protease proteolytic subunit n=1 Tax=Flavilitoribacter nigricans (strain ATCC 23147 / DSM 23189 / NBRC 102662 / NCIMB 1420 / SS-2) TaxID=1122177 RepID=A0A2D0NF24_FLAN2|nr:head maturation protease, ClpP-related [Flavilitoribacter nigricans]PHN06956.1 hypothetical protein CRP01_09070 [Flavilitoribacter nigricans DSM 23189 = NBRC 102662]